MKKRFVILLDGSTKEQEQAFLQHIKDSGEFGWWHWLNGSWLLYTSNLAYDAHGIREIVGRFFPNMHHMVLELRADGSDWWYGFGPNNKEKNMFEWMRENWKK
jgi:hypothetical protein